MNEIVKFCNLNNEDNEFIERFEKLNLKRQDIYLVKAEGKCYICFKEKENRIEKLISKLNRIKKAIERGFEKRIEIMNLIVR